MKPDPIEIIFKSFPKIFFHPYPPRTQFVFSRLTYKFSFPSNSSHPFPNHPPWHDARSIQASAQNAFNEISLHPANILPACDSALLFSSMHVRTGTRPKRYRITSCWWAEAMFNLTLPAEHREIIKSYCFVNTQQARNMIFELRRTFHQ